MAVAVRFGDTAPVFGLVSESSMGYVQDFNQKTLEEEVLADDNVGNTIAATYFNLRWEGSFTLIANTGGVFPAIATAATIANLADGITKAIITEVDRKPEQKGYEKTTFTFKAWSTITLA